jgi:hypothetical protein
MAKKKSPIASVQLPLERIERKILLIRDHKIMLDADLAELYGVPTGVLVRQVKRNPKRFPRDFCFQLTAAEWEVLRCQSGISKGRGGRRYAPYAFSEQGVAMLSSVLNSTQAIEVNVQIMRAFVTLREMLSTHKDLAQKLAELEKKYDHHFAVVFDAIRKLMEPPPVSKKRPIGFIGNDNDPAE